MRSAWFARERSRGQIPYLILSDTGAPADTDIDSDTDADTDSDADADTDSVTVTDTGATDTTGDSDVIDGGDTTCVPSDEVCDGIDNDCDTAIDDSITPLCMDGYECISGVCTLSNACSWTGGPPAFGAARSLGVVNTAYSEIDPVLSHDGLSLYFVSYRDDQQGNDIYVATRTGTTADFGDGTWVGAASTELNDTHPFVAPDDLEAFVASNRSGTTGDADIFRATRSSPGDAWGDFTVVANVNSTGGDFDPHLEGDRLTLWFDPVGRLEGLGLQDLFYAERTDPSSPFGTPTPATNLNSTDNDWDVSLRDDGQVIVFQSDRDASRHVYYAVRSSHAAPFSAPAIVTALDSYISTLSDPFITPDGCAIYFAAELIGGEGSEDLYVIEAAP